MTALIIYLFGAGIVATLCYLTFQDRDVTVLDLIVIAFLTMCSWVTLAVFFAMFLSAYLEKTHILSSLAGFFDKVIYHGENRKEE